MQQTQKYKLNLIETSDTFSPAPLNENMEKVEAQLTAVRDGAEEKATALDQRVTVLEGHKILAGTYTGNGSTQTISLGFTPLAVIAQPPGNLSYLAVQGGTCSYIAVEEGGFKVSSYLNQGGTYNFFAIL